MKTIQGLWAEMLIIEQSKNPEYLIRSWHSSPNSKFDFNDGQNKLEIKSTSQTKRIHSFSYEQTIPNPNSKLLIASIKVIETGVGKSILDLRDNICKKVLDLDLQYKVKPLNEYWEEIIIRRIKNFFDVRPCRYEWTLPKEAKLIDLYLIDSNKERIKDYM